MPTIAAALVLGGLLLTFGASPRAATNGPAAGATAPSPCGMAAAEPWIRKWFAAWELTAKEILRLSDTTPPEFVLFDSSCVYTTSAVAARGASPGDGPALRGVTLPWRALAHGDSITLPDSTRVPVGLMSFAHSAKRTGPYFVMAAPSYWAALGHTDSTGLTAVFLHEFAHTRQVRGMAAAIGPIDSAWAYPEELDDDALQTRFQRDSVYSAAWRAECDLMYRAAAADSRAETRELATRALAMMRSRHARWLRGEHAVFATLDDIWLSMEGAGQWTGYAWLAHPRGGGLGPAAAVEKMRGRGRRWSQEQGLGLMLVVDRLLPTWPEVVFREPSLGATDLLERAVAR